MEECPFVKQIEQMESFRTDEKRWHVLNFINKKGKPSPKNIIDDYNSKGHDLELFAPVIRPAHIVNGKVRYVERLLTFFYIFVRGTSDEIKEICVRPDNELSLMIDKGSARHRYAIVSDDAMENFKIFARAHTNAIPFYNIDDIELNEGDLVEVIDGEYAGLRGVFMPKSRSSKGNLVIATSAQMGAVLWDIDSKIVRILEFARNTRRQYDLIDSFIPKLLPILRKFHAEESLTDKEKTQLNVFNQRMGKVSPANNKAEAKLLATLMPVQSILGDVDGLRHTQQRFEKRKAALTNIWTLALAELMISVALNDMARLKKAYSSIQHQTDSLTNTQAQLTE